MIRPFLLSTVLALFAALSPLRGQEELPLSIMEATSIGVGGYNLMDTYLTPGATVNYSGVGLSVLNERMKMTGIADGNISRQQLLRAEFSSTSNGAGTKSNLELLGQYALNYHYHFTPLPNLKLLAGGGARGLLGMIYNMQNGNNPVSVKADLDLNLSGMAIYQLAIKDYPVTLRYQVDLPFSGICFAPKYGQSYYEMFGLSNSGRLVRYNSFHNKFAIQNYLTADFPIGNFTIRAAFHHQAYHTDMNGIKSHVISRSFMIGFVREFISWGGKKSKRMRESYRSAFY